MPSATMSDFPVAIKITNSKRHSFSPGPRPLRLALASTAAPGSTGPTISPLTSYSTSSPRSESPRSGALPNATRCVRKHGAPRRQSSISYFTPDKETTTTQTPTRHVLTRSVSVGAKPSLSSGVGGDRSGDRRSTVSVEFTQSEKVSTPHTLAEKHADLLQFIARKESKCLELRSQLAVHEAELLQLKRKWERIVNRGFERSNAISDYAPPLNSTSVSSTAAQIQGGAMLDGIREGVQGVSRLIAAGLGELSAAPAPSSPTLTSASRQTPARRRHLTQPSSSSISTYATNGSTSTRLSQSSASSLGDEPGEAERENEDEGEEALMSKDSEAKPPINANPKRKLHSGPSESSFGISSKDRTSISSLPERTAKIHRRKSKDCSSPPSFDLSTTTSASVVAPSAKQTLKAKRASVNALPPVASIPGLESLTTVSGSSSQPVTSWVGKKWEEIQSGSTFTKHQKRASVLLSDVSQTIASALSSPPLASASYNPTLAPYMPTSSSSTGSITPLQSSSVSLLDEDDADAAVHGGLGGTGLGDVMMPVQVSVQPSAQMGSASVNAGDAGAAQTLDEEDWGW